MAEHDPLQVSAVLSSIGCQFIYHDPVKASSIALQAEMPCVDACLADAAVRRRKRIDSFALQTLLAFSPVWLAHGRHKLSPPAGPDGCKVQSGVNPPLPGLPHFRGLLPHPDSRAPATSSTSESSSCQHSLAVFSGRRFLQDRSLYPR